MTHFLVEGIKLRHICDWALLIKHEQNNINWNEFYQWTDKLHYTKFANSLTYVSARYLGLTLSSPFIQRNDIYSERILEDMFCHNSLFNKGYGLWTSRIKSVQNRLRSIWKFHKIYQRYVFGTILQQVMGFIFDRKPTL